MLVDNHEPGGDGVRLGELSRRLKEWDVQHKTYALPCGDYQWVWRKNGREVTLPVVLERKRADDLAESIKDGRFLKQKDRMREWRSDFGILSDEVSLHYMVESTPAAYRVRCMDGCNGVGKCGNPSVEQLEVAIDELRNSSDFQLVQTENVEGSVEYLATVTADLQRRVSLGDFDTLRMIRDNRASPHSSTGRGTLPHTTGRGTLPHTTGRGKLPHKKGPASSSTCTSSSISRDMEFPLDRYSVGAENFHANVGSTKMERSSAYSPSGQRIPSRSATNFHHSESPKFSQTKSSFSDSPKSSSSSLESYSSPGPRRKRPYVAIDIDEVFDDNAEKKPRVVSSFGLDFPESQDDDLTESVFAETSGSSSHFDTPTRATSTSKWEHAAVDGFNLESLDSYTSASKQKKSSAALRSPGCSGGATRSPRLDDEDKIRAVQEVIPDSSMSDVIRALASAGGSVDGAVMILLEGPPTDGMGQQPHKVESRTRASSNTDCIDLT